ncbi:MAG: hypothetical protein ACREKN_03935 [Longimicrobiaceae bacterium]
MNRLPILAAAFVLALTGCEVEPTPRRLYEDPTPEASAGAEAGDEVRLRLELFADALASGEAEQAVEVLRPSADVRAVTGVDADEVRGRERLVAALGEVSGTRGGLPRPEIRVSANEDGGVAWFLVGWRGREGAVWLTGVLLRREEEWHLIQVHLDADGATLPPSPRSPPERGPGEGG